MGIRATVELIAAILDDPKAPDVCPMLESLRGVLGMEILNTDAEAA